MALQAYPLVDDVNTLRGEILSRPPLALNTLGIDRASALGEFSAFVGCYDLSNPQIAHKDSHTLRVTLNADEMAMRAAAGEDLYAEDKPQREQVGTGWVPDTGICFLMGLLHDLGRFPQYAMYRTYSDPHSFPHAEMSYDMLAKFGMVERFAPLPADDDGLRDERNRMLRAIRVHSLLSLGDVSGSDLAYCEILRDADRIDILETYCHAVSSPDFLEQVERSRQALERGEELPLVNPADAPSIYGMARWEASGFSVSDAVLADLARGGLVDRAKIRTAGDSIMSVIAMWSGMEIGISRSMVAERGTMVAIGESVIETYGRREDAGTLVREVRRIIGL